MGDDLSPYIVKFEKGTTVFLEGDEGDDMFFVHSGKIRIEKTIEGKAEVLAVMEKGDFFGEMAVLDQVPRTATAIVDEDAELLKVDSSNLESLLRNNIEIAVRMIRKYASRLREANTKLASLMKDRNDMDKGIKEIIHSVKQGKLSEEKAPLLANFIGAKAVGTFPIKKENITIGRKDPVTHIVPDVDLTAADKTRSISRRHARLQCIQNQFLLTEEVGVRNGTFVNGERLKPGIPMTITDGAQITFGKVEVTFQLAKSG